MVPFRKNLQSHLVSFLTEFGANFERILSWVKTLNFLKIKKGPSRIQRNLNICLGLPWFSATWLVLRFSFDKSHLEHKH